MTANPQFKKELTDEISVSDVAIEQLLSLTKDEEDVAGVRVYVSGGGCSGMTYGMTLVEEPTDFDATWSKNGLNMYVDAIALSYLDGVEIDFQTQGANKSFVFKNVFAQTGGAGTCGGCGSAGG